VVNEKKFAVKKLSSVVLGLTCTGHVTLRMRSGVCSLHSGINAILPNYMA